MFIIKQTDPLLPYKFNRYGCRFMSLLAIPQFVKQEWIGAVDIIKIYETLRAKDNQKEKDNKKRIFADAEVLQMGGRENYVINAGFHLLRLAMHGAQIGISNDDKIIRWGWASDESAYPATHMIVHWVTDGTDGHWTLFDMHDNEIYDPHDPEQADYKINKRRIDKRLVYSYWEI